MNSVVIESTINANSATIFGVMGSIKPKKEDCVMWINRRWFRKSRQIVAVWLNGCIHRYVTSTVLVLKHQSHWITKVRLCLLAYTQLTPRHPPYARYAGLDDRYCDELFSITCKPAPALDTTTPANRPQSPHTASNHGGRRALNGSDVSGLRIACLYVAARRLRADFRVTRWLGCAAFFAD